MARPAHQTHTVPRMGKELLKRHGWKAMEIATRRSDDAGTTASLVFYEKVAQWLWNERDPA